MNTIKVRDIEIGAGAPNILVPIVGVTKDDIIAEAKTFDSIPVDMVEWLSLIHISTFWMKVAKNTWLRIPSLKAKASLRNS